MIRVLVDERRALLQSVEAGRDGGRGVGGGGDVAEEGVLVGDKRWLVGCLRAGEVCEGGHFGFEGWVGGCWFGGGG